MLELKATRPLTEETEHYWSLPPGDEAGLLRRFAHNAMATTFELILVHPEAETARQAAHAAFHELDLLEFELSRYIPTSDLACLRELEPGAFLHVGVATYECLQIARRLHEETHGAFDVTIGPLLDWWRARGLDAALTPEQLERDPEWRAARARVGMDKVILNESELSVAVAAPGLVLDLGAIGKGYAVDAIAALLREWEIPAALIHGGESSVYGYGSPTGAEDGWPVALRNPEDPARTLGTLRLREASLSGSGLTLHGRHILDPRTGRPAAGRLGTWALAAGAAASDGLSTAFMVLGEGEIEAFCAEYKDVSGLLLSRDESGLVTRRFGQWEMSG